MIIQKPITATIAKNDQYRTALHFERGQVVPFYIRGAIAWPEGPQEGFALLAGQRISDSKIFIFEQFRFWTIAHWLNPDGSLKTREDGSGHHLGLIQVIQDWEALYKCAAYFHGGQHIDVVRRHSLELYRHPLLPRRTGLIEVPYVKEVGDDLIREKGRTNRYMLERHSFLGQALEQWLGLQAAGVGDNNMIHCLRVILAGYEANPYVKTEI